MMAKWIDQAADAPSVGFLHGDDLAGTAASAFAKVASGSGTVKIIRTEPPPRDSGLKF